MHSVCFLVQILGYIGRCQSVIASGRNKERVDDWNAMSWIQIELTLTILDDRSLVIKPPSTVTVPQLAHSGDSCHKRDLCQIELTN